MGRHQKQNRFKNSQTSDPASGMSFPQQTKFTTFFQSGRLEPVYSAAITRRDQLSWVVLQTNVQMIKSSGKEAISKRG